MPLRRKPLRKKSKKKTLARQFNDLVTEAKRLARERDKVCQAANVISGNIRACGGHLQGSHIFPEGQYKHMAADVDNIIGLCYTHHLAWWHKNPLEATEWFREKYGEEKYVELRSRAYQKPIPQIDILFINKKKEELKL